MPHHLSDVPHAVEGRLIRVHDLGPVGCVGQGRHQLLQISSCQGGFSTDSVLNVLQNILSEFSGPSGPLGPGRNKILWLAHGFSEQPAYRVLPTAQASADFTVLIVLQRPLYTLIFYSFYFKLWIPRCTGSCLPPA